jgi:FkbM family methyltransferase
MHTQQFVKKSVQTVLSGLVLLLAKSKIGRFLFRTILERALHETEVMHRDGLTFRFSVANPLLGMRARTLFTKEPETLEWIDRMQQGAVLWDVGANAGTYTVYAAVARRAKVVAFEPSVFNLEFLARNININDIVNAVTLVPVPLSDCTKISEMRLSSSEWGGALSTFGETYDANGDPLVQIFGYQMPGLTMDDAKQIFSLAQPDFIKIDVDGIEALILAGGEEVLSGASSVLIEINDDFESQAVNCELILKRLGFTLKEKRQSDFEIRDNSDHFTTFNQIWTRD